MRYPTAGTTSNAETQPFYVNSPYGIVLAHVCSIAHCACTVSYSFVVIDKTPYGLQNGNLTNGDELARFLDVEAHRHINTSSDSEILLNILAYELHAIRKPRIDHEDIFNAVRQVHSRCRGGYAVVAMVPGMSRR